MSLLPSHKSKFDKRFEELFGVSLDSLDIGVITTAADTAPVVLLPHLLKSFNVEYSGDDERVARELLKSALITKKGTAQSLKSALKSFFDGGKLLEWMEYGGSAYHFRVEMDVKEHGLTNSLSELDSIIEKHKNVRSVCEWIRIVIHANTLAIYTAVSRLDAERVTINPYVPTNLDITHAPSVASYSVLGEEITINTKGKI